MREATSSASGANGIIGPLGPRNSRVEDVAERIRELVLAGRLRGGTRMSDSLLAREMGVGRSSVREAFRLLTAEGLLERTTRGLQVATPTVEDVRDAFELRLAVECRAVRIVATRHDDKVLYELGEILAEFEAAVEAEDSDATTALDLRFHEAVCRLSGSRRLHEVFKREVVTMLALLQMDSGIYEPLSDWSHELPLILTAIARGEATAASDAMEHHIERARVITLEYTARRQMGMLA
jgi:DNA-binding GntR family transcriptional regulator